MEAFPWGFFVFASVINVALIAVAVWFAWIMVSSIRGIHQELTRIRRNLVSRQDAGGTGV
ncbi:MAG: hypothetical protein ACN0LA_10735 [Candidatus Longimicrobiales bacterium M2_2A_002]